MKKIDRWDYLHFPIHLIPHLLEDQTGTVMDMIYCGISYQAKSLEGFDGNEMDAIRFVIGKLSIPFQIEEEEVVRRTYAIYSEPTCIDFYGSAKVTRLTSLLREEKKPRYLMDFMASIALRSILGKKSKTFTLKATILARMLGYKSCHDVPMQLNNTQEFVYYSHDTPDKMNRMFKRLEKDYGYGKSRSTRRGWKGYRVVKTL